MLISHVLAQAASCLGHSLRAGCLGLLRQTCLPALPIHRAAMLHRAAQPRCEYVAIHRASVLHRLESTGIHSTGVSMWRSTVMLCSIVPHPQGSTAGVQVCDDPQSCCAPLSRIHRDPQPGFKDVMVTIALRVPLPAIHFSPISVISQNNGIIIMALIL